MEKEIIKQLHSLKQLAPRQEWKDANRMMLMRFIQTQESVPSRASNTRVAVNFFGSIFKRVAFQPAAALLLFLGAALSSSLVVNAAFYSLPGEPLYALKIRMERAQVALTQGQDQKNELKVELARKRVVELDKIIVRSEKQEDTSKKVHLAINNFNQNVEPVKQGISKTNSKETNYKIAISLGDTTSELKATLTKSEDVLSEDVKKTLENAIDSVEDTGISVLSQPTDPATDETVQDDQTTEDVVKFLTSALENVKKQIADILEQTKDATLDTAVLDNLKLVDDNIITAEKDIAETALDKAASDIQAAKQALSEIKAALEPVEETPEASPEPTATPEATPQQDDSVTTPEIISENSMDTTNSESSDPDAS